MIYNLQIALDPEHLLALLHKRTPTTSTLRLEVGDETYELSFSKHTPATHTHPAVDPSPMSLDEIAHAVASLTHRMSGQTSHRNAGRHHIVILKTTMKNQPGKACYTSFWGKLRRKWDWWIYCRAVHSLRRMTLDNPGMAYLMELQLREWNEKLGISQSLRRATECFHDSLRNQSHNDKEEARR